MGAFRAAVSSGIGPLDFWKMTPFLTRNAVRGTQDHRATLAWMIANLSRSKKLPKLDKITSKEQIDHHSMENAMKQALRGIGKK
jgi:hypothetical protein